MQNPFDTKNPFDAVPVSATPPINPGLLAKTDSQPVDFSKLDIKPRIEQKLPFESTRSGVIYNTIVGLQDPRVTVPALADIFHGFTDMIGSYAISANDIFHGGNPSGEVDFGKVGDSVSPILGTVMRGLYGTEPVPDVATRLQGAYDSPITQSIAKYLPATPGVTDQDTNTKLNAVKLAVLGIIGGDALNFLGGGEASIEKNIIASVTDRSSLKLLKDLGLSNDLAAKFASTVTGARNAEDAKAVLQAVRYAHGAQAVAESGPTTALSGQIREQFPELPAKAADDIAGRAIKQPDFLNPAATEEFITKEVQAYKPEPVVTPNIAPKNESPATTPELQGLAEEARKYKSAEEFMNRGKDTYGEPVYVYHTTPIKNLESIKSQGLLPDGERSIHFAQDVKSGANWGNEGEPLFRALKVDVKGLEEAKSTYNTVSTKIPVDPHFLEVSMDRGKTWKPLRENSLKTKSQLTDFYNQTKQGNQAVVPTASTDGVPYTAEEAAGRYWDEVISQQKAGGKTIEVSGDEMKKFFHGDYDPNKSDMYAKASYDTMKRLLQDSEVKTFAWLGGGPGAGKSEFIGEAIKNGNLADVLYDTSLSNEKGIRALLDLAKKNGKSVDVHAILANLQQARKHTLLREAATGRPVADEVFADRHTDFPQTLKNLIKDGSLSKDQVQLYDLRNVTNPDEARQIIRLGISQADPLATLQKVKYDRNVIRDQYARRSFAQENIRGPSVTGESGAPGGLPGANRTDNGGGGGSLESQDTGGKAAVGERATPRIEEKQTPEARAAQEAAIQEQQDRGPQLPPSVGDIILESGRKVPIERAPADALAELSNEPDAGSWQSLVKGYMYNFSPTKKAHVLDYLATPEFVLEKVGLGKGAEMLQDAKDVYRDTLKKEFAKIEAWKKEINDPQGSRLIFQYLDGREKESVRDMTNEEQAVAQEIRTYLKDWAKRLKLPEDNQISRYITHIFERDFSGPPENTFVDPELAAIMSENVAKSVYDPFLQKRLGKGGYVEDVWRALDAYVKRASRKEAMDPALETLSDMAKHLDDRTYNYVMKLSHRVNMRPTELEKSMDSLITQTPIGQYFTDRPVAFLSRKLRQIFYRGTLGLNFSSALRNLSQGANTYAKLGEKYTTVGYAKLFQRMASRNLDELYAQNILSDELIQDRQIGVMKKGMQKVDKALFGLFETAEKINRGAAYFGAKSKALGKGLSEEEAIKYAKRMVRETQFSFGAIDTPVALNDDVIKTITQLQSYNIKQIEFLGRMIRQKDFTGLIRYGGATLTFLYTIGRLFGMTANQIIPTVGIGGAPFTSTMTSIPGLFSSDPQTQAKAQSQLQRNLASLFPAGAQIRKTVQGAAALEKGKSTTPTGKFRFRVGSEDAAQALIFGPNSLPQAQKYYDSLGKKKTQTSNPFD